MSSHIVYLYSTLFTLLLTPLDLMKVLPIFIFYFIYITTMKDIKNKMKENEIYILLYLHYYGENDNGIFFFTPEFIFYFIYITTGHIFLLYLQHFDNIILSFLDFIFYIICLLSCKFNFCLFLGIFMFCHSGGVFALLQIDRFYFVIKNY